MKRCKTCQFLPCRCEDLAAGYTGHAHLPRCWPQTSEALAVHVDQIGEATEHARSLGVPTEFNKLGQPVFRDRAHRREFHRAYGVFDRDAGYSDASPGSFRGDRPDPKKPNLID